MYSRSFYFLYTVTCHCYFVINCALVTELVLSVNCQFIIIILTVIFFKFLLLYLCYNVQYRCCSET